MLRGILLAYLALVSVAAFAAAAWDKARARRGGRRIPEATLLGLALVGGSPGLVLAMLVVRHKTQKLAFLVPLALILLAQGALAWWLLR